MKFKISLLCSLLLVVNIYSDELITFTPNTPAKAEEVNQNFQLLQTQIDELKQQLSSIKENQDVTRNLSVHYEFENNLNDSVGNNNGREIGTLTYVDGILGKAVYLDGSSNALILKEYYSFNVPLTHDISISSWVKLENSTNSIVILNSYSRDGIYSFGIGENRIYFRYAYDWGVENQIEVTDVNISAGQYYHVAMVKEANTFKLYLNGDLVGSQVFTETALTWEGSNGTGGQQSGIVVNGQAINGDATSTAWGPFEGYFYLDDLRIYNVPLDSNEIDILSNMRE